MSFILQQGKEIVFKVSNLLISNKSFMILIKVVMKHLRVFYLEEETNKIWKTCITLYTS